MSLISIERPRVYQNASRRSVNNHVTQLIGSNLMVEEIPLYCVHDCERHGDIIYYGMELSVGRIKRAYSRLYEALNHEKGFSRLMVKDCDYIYASKGTLVDASDKDNPIILMMITISNEAVNESKYKYSHDSDIDYDDFKLYLSHDFVMGTKPEYEKLYKKLMKEYLNQAYEFGMDIRHVPNIRSLFFIETSFPQFDNLRQRISFQNELGQFLIRPRKINFVTEWQQIVIDKQDTNGNATALAGSQESSDSKSMSLERITRIPTSEQAESLVDFSTTSGLIFGSSQESSDSQSTYRLRRSRRGRRTINSYGEWIPMRQTD